MDEMTLSAPQKVLDALKNGAKIAVFTLDDDENPTLRLGEIILHNSRKFDNSSELLEPAIRYLNHNYNKDIRLKRLADLCDISPAYFSRTFTKVTGKCLLSYVTDLRLEQACRLLVSTSRSVVSVANEVGYVDCGYFYKLFKKKYNCTPLQFRNSKLQ